MGMFFILPSTALCVTRVTTAFIVLSCSGTLVNYSRKSRPLAAKAVQPYFGTRKVFPIERGDKNSFLRKVTSL